MSLNTIAPASLAEISAGLVCGTLLDTIFPNKPVTEDNGYMILVEGMLQGVVSTVVAGTVLNYLKKKGYYEGSSNNYAFFLSYLSAQPALIAKLTGSMAFLKMKLGTMDFSMAPVTQANNNAVPAPTEMKVINSLHGNPNPHTEMMGTVAALV